jgi:hypothetical protein
MFSHPKSDPKLWRWSEAAEMPVLRRSLLICSAPMGLRAGAGECACLVRRISFGIANESPYSWTVVSGTVVRDTEVCRHPAWNIGPQNWLEILIVIET